MKQVINEVSTAAFEETFYDAVDAPACEGGNMHLVNSAVSYVEKSSDVVEAFEHIRDTAIYIQEISIHDN